MMLNLIDYKGKFDIIQDKDIEDGLDIVVGEISEEEAIKQAKGRVDCAIYYGVPAIITNNQNLKDIYQKLYDEWEATT